MTEDEPKVQEPSKHAISFIDCPRCRELLADIDLEEPERIRPCRCVLIPSPREYIDD